MERKDRKSEVQTVRIFQAWIAVGLLRHYAKVTGEPPQTILPYDVRAGPPERLDQGCSK